MNKARVSPTRHARPARRPFWGVCAWVILLIGITASVVASSTWRSSLEADEQRSFEATATDVADTIHTQFVREMDLTASAATLLALHPDTTYPEIEQWTDSIGADDRYPESFGFDYIRRVAAEDLPAYTDAVVRDPAPAGGVFNPGAIIPFGQRAEYCLAHLQVYQAHGTELLESQTALMEQVDWCGLDIGRTLRRVTLSGKPVTIMLPTMLEGMGNEISTEFGIDPAVAAETLAEITAGMDRAIFVIAPVYDDGVAPSTVAGRFAAVRGWVGAAFDAGLILDRALDRHAGMAVTVEPVGSDHLVAVSSGTAAPDGSRSTSFVDANWVITVAGAATSTGIAPGDAAFAALVAGVALTFLLFLLVQVLSTSRNRALGLVDAKTEELRHLALHDALTGLPNRTLVLDRAEQAMARARREHTTVTLLFLDLDNFKDINDTLGHAAGDQLLVAVGARLHAALRTTDTLGRIGGDEFVVVAEDPSLGADPALVAERITEMLREPFCLGDGGAPYTVTASIGVASGERASAQDLLRDADIALYEAKDAGKDCYVVFEHQMQDEVANRLELDRDLRDALDAGQFLLMYQPTFGIHDATTTGVEALLRWEHPTRGLVGPMDFVPLLEQNGLIVPVGRWVLREACRAGAGWHAMGHRIAVSVNVSARQLEGGTLADDVAAALEQSGLDPAYLVIEITESTLMRDASTTVDRLAALKHLGIRVAIDDFGTGYSSLAYLRQFPVDILKIDRSFIAGIGRSGESAALVHTLIQLGKTLGLETVAEGIEDASQLDRLQSENCDTGQGFLHSRPLRPGDLTELLFDQAATAAGTGDTDGVERKSVDA